MKAKRIFEWLLRILLIISIALNILLLRFLSASSQQRGGYELSRLQDEAYFLEQTLVGLDFSVVDSMGLLDSHSKKRTTFQWSSKPYSAILVFSSIACNSCLNREAQMLADLSMLSLPSLDFHCIVQSEEEFYLHRFMKVNQIRFPVYIDDRAETSHFLDVGIGPAILVVDNSTGLIVNAYASTPSLDRRSEDFGRSLARLGNCGR